MEATSLPSEPLRILMASGVPKRREGGVAAIIYNLGRELENRGQALLTRCDDMTEALQAFKAKRAPNFSGR